MIINMKEKKTKKLDVAHSHGTGCIGVHSALKLVFSCNSSEFIT